MTRGDVQRGDSVVISTVAGASSKDYPLAAIPNNYSYEDVSDQPEAQPNQPLSVPLSFHGGLAYGKYDERTSGAMFGSGILANEPNILRAPIAPTTVTLTDAASPPTYFFEGSAADATVTYDATATGLIENTDTDTFSLTCADQEGGLLLVMVASDGTAVSAVTYNGDALTKRTVRVSGSRRVTVYYLLEPDVGSAYDVVVTMASSCDAVAIASSYYNVNQDNPFGSTTTTGGTSNAASTTVTCSSGDEVVDILCTGNVTATKDASQDAIDDDLADTTIRGGCSRETSSGISVVMSWALGASSQWLILGIPIHGITKPVFYAISVEDGEVNLFKISLAASNYGTLLNTKTFSQTTTPPQGRPAEWNNGTNTYWTLGLGDNGKIQQLTTIASGASADTWTASADADARHLFVVGEDLYRTTGANEVCILPRAGDPTSEAAWGGENYMGDAGTNITDIGEAAGISRIAKEDGFYEWDGVEGTGRNVLPEIGRATRNGQGMVYWHGGFVIPTAQLWWTRTGTPIGPDSNPENTANDPSKGSTSYFKHGRWNGLAEFGAYLYGLYVSSDGSNAYLAWGRERHSGDPPGWGPLIWHSLDLASGDFNDFHGIFVTETSEFSATETRPCLWFANGNDVSYLWLDKDGAPSARRGDIDLATSGAITSGRIDFGLPRVQKQLRVIDGWAEDFGSVTGNFQFSVYLDGGSIVNIGSAISSDGYFEAFWTQDASDVCRSMLAEATWTGSSSLTDTNGPHLRDVTVRAVALPDTTPVWTLLFAAEDGSSRTGKKIRSELEGYKNDLLKYKLPDEDSFNGVMTGIRLLRADEIRDLTERSQKPPKYILAATIRKMVAS